MKRLTVLCVLLLAAWVHAEAPATQPATLLTIGGPAAKAMTVDEKAFATLKRVDVKVKDHAGQDVTYSGMAVRDVLQLAGVPIGAGQMRGPYLTMYVVAEAKDGYRAVYSLAELDAEFAERNFLLADRRDGKPLSEKEGPLRLIAPEEKKQARWVRQVTALNVYSAIPNEKPVATEKGH